MCVKAAMGNKTCALQKECSSLRGRPGKAAQHFTLQNPAPPIKAHQEKPVCLVQRRVLSLITLPNFAPEKYFVHEWGVCVCV